MIRWESLVWVLLFFLVILANSAIAEDSTTVERIVPEITAVRINPHPPVIDGKLDDAVWNEHDFTIARDFRQRDPDEGEAETESTLVVVAYDDNAVYFGIRCYDSKPEKITRQLVRRDRWSESDKIIVRIDPYHDHQTGNAFEVNASGVQRDYRMYEDNNIDYAWDGVWEANVHSEPWGWSAEMRIPYHCLRFTEKEAHTWGIDFVRVISRKAETTQWAFSPAGAGGRVSKFGHLTGLTGIRPAGRLEVLPYAVSNLEVGEAASGNPDGRRTYENTGVDLKYGLSSNLTLDATINPDFGQVELDSPVLNLSAFESYFSEKRPFFLEGSDLFRTDFQLFYSRRIGRQPSEYLWDAGYRHYDPDYSYPVDRPNATTILGAAKLTGKLANGTSIGFLNAVTQEETEKYMTAGGITREGVVEPTANYSVMRVKQDIFGNSNIGAMMTLASQDYHHPAMTGGVDWRLQTGNGLWGLRGQTVFSRVDNVNTGFGLDVTAEKLAGKHIRGAVGGTIKDPHLQINRLGFTSRNDQQNAWGWIQYRTQDDWWIIRNSYNNFNTYFTWNYAGVNINKGGNFNTYIEFLNNWSLGGGVSIQAERYSDLETRGNGLWEWPVHPTFSWWASLNTDYRKKVSFRINPGSGGDRGGSWWANYVGAEYRPRGNMEFSVGVNYHRSFNGTRWITNWDHDGQDDTDKLAMFADLDNDRVSMYLTAGVMLTRNLSWQISGQGLISSLDYHNYRQYLGGNNYDPNVGYTGNHDGTYSALNSTMLVRWEYRPGSTIYFVWTRSRPEWDDSINNLEISNEIDRFFSRGAENVWLIKASYWWNI